MWKAIGNWYTTLLGFAGGVVTYLVQVGPNMPKTKSDWGGFILALLLAGLGAAAKDGRTGSPPGATQ